MQKERGIIRLPSLDKSVNSETHCMGEIIKVEREIQMDYLVQISHSPIQ